MATLVDVIFVFVKNPIEIFEETSRLLIKIADNILQNPSNLKVRTLQKTNGTVSKKILNVPGGVEFLKLMGFKENTANYSLPENASLQNIETVKNEIKKLIGDKDYIAGESSKTTEKVIKAESSKTPINEEIIKRLSVPVYESIFSNPFLKEIEKIFNFVLVYENKELQARAKSYIPVAQLEDKAQDRLRLLQEQIKKQKLQDPNLDLNDMLLLELLEWFKNDFFQWVDTLDCDTCGGKTEMSHMSHDKELLLYTQRVEMHKCTSCKRFTPFPRYDDQNILLETRRGRCGEWANVFTLLCRAMGWDARYVIDKTDHVWTEVYSYSQKRWLHCDPCENICDKPLMYETGWNKQVSYIIAYSAEGVQDVTWRYTSQFKNVLNRRKLCTEAELVKALLELGKIRQKNISKSRQDFLTKRLLSELVELMIEKKSSESDQTGRTSGSLAWRMSRGELCESKSFTWIIPNSIKEDVIITYSSSLNIYEMRDNSNKLIKNVDGWQNGAHSCEELFRKVESDWKVVYLTRTEGSNEGKISWKFELEDNNSRMDAITIKLLTKTFESGTVTLTMCDNTSNQCIKLTREQEEGEVITSFSGSKSVTLSAHLTGGKGNVGWQHAQLFRDTIDSKESQFSIKFHLSKNV